MEKDLFNDKYRLYVDFERLNNIPNKIDSFWKIAKIRNVTQKEDVMFILYDKNHYDDNNYIMYTRKMNIDGKDYWCAIIRDEYLERMQKNIKLAAFGLYHELGHFLNNDYENKEKINNKELSKMRKRAIESGKVLDMETKADEFAVKQVGKSTAINFLDYSIMRRKKLDNSNLGILELELRKKHIKNLNI